MEAKAKLLGHPIHQMLIVFPLGLLLMALAFDVAYLITRNASLAVVSYWDIAAGIATGLLAAVFGLIDWIAIPIRTRAKAVGAWHAGINVTMLMLFGASWLLRYTAPEHTPSTTAFALALAAAALGGVGGWLGGELVGQHGIGVNPGANVDAPSSLRSKPRGD